MNNSTKTTLLLFALSAIMLYLYFDDFFITLFFALGALWGLINVYLIEQVLHEALIVKQKKLLKIAVLTLVKFPLLYGVGVYLLYLENGSALGLLAGFTLSLLLYIRNACLSLKKLVPASSR